MWGTHLPGVILGKIYGYVGRYEWIMARCTCVMWSRAEAWVEKYTISRLWVKQELRWLHWRLRILRFSYEMKKYVVTSDVMTAICKFKELEQLVMYGCFSKVNLEVLGELRNLKRLVIGGEVMDLYWLKELKGLNVLIFNCCQVVDTWSMNCICELEELKELEIHEYENFCDVGRMMVMLNRLSRLERLKISSPIRIYLDLRGMKGLKILDLQLLHNWAGLESFEAMKELKVLSLSSRTTNNELRKLGEVGLEKLEVLNVSGCDIDDDVMGYIGNMHMLRTLDLSGCAKITDAGMDKLKGLARLKELNVKGCVNIIDVGIRSLDGLGLERLRGLVKLKELNMKDVGRRRLDELGLERFEFDD